MKATPAAISAFMNGDFDNFLVASTPGGIEAQEAAGQAALVASAMLPREINGPYDQSTLERMGIVFGKPVDDLFVSVTLPEGWQLQATSHSMWSDLLDEQGRVRAAIFYKAAFYDRSAHISPTRFFLVSTYEPCLEDGRPAKDGQHTHYQTVVFGGGRPVYYGALRKCDDYEASTLDGKEAYKWLVEHYPEYENVLAYWG